ncbi:MAG: MerR family transcriptional regulator [Candidatus Dormibacteraeota bacterium]|nr:MerR family transcriptional regulator [Candidatus Dormibacteraeota bacterium]
MAPEKELALTIGELAAMVGVSTDIIRAWERRHAVLSPGRTPTRHRRYTMEDVETLRRVRHNVSARGLSLKLAVAEAQGMPLDDPAGHTMAPEVSLETPPVADAAPWRAVADLLGSVVCILDERGDIVDANMAFARVAGVLRPRLRGMRFLDLVEPGDRAKAARLYRPTPQRRRGWEINMRTAMLSGLFTFDTYVLPTMTSAFIVLIGGDLSGSGMELWPQVTTTDGRAT